MSANIVRQQLIEAFRAVDLGWPVRWENVAFQEPESGYWAAVGFWPGEPETATLGGEGQEELTGWLQVDLNAPPNNGEAALLDAYADLRAAFPPGEAFLDSGVTTTIISCGRSPGRRVDENYRISVTIRFRARYNKNT
jgi:hypothetical protein